MPPAAWDERLFASPCAIIQVWIRAVEWITACGNIDLRVRTYDDYRCEHDNTTAAIDKQWLASPELGHIPP